MLKDIWIPRLVDILPQNILADEKLHAAAEALDLELKALSYDARQVLHLPRLDELPHEVLDTLGWQMHCDRWEPETMSLETKRNLIRQSIFWHRIKGTPESIRIMLGAFGIDADTEEWWEYNGEPYFFKLKVSNVAYLGDDGETFLRLVYAAKNERSWLDAFIFDLLQVDDNLYIGVPEVDASYEKISEADVPTGKLDVAVLNGVVDTTIDIADYDFPNQQVLEARLDVVNILIDNDYEIFDAAPLPIDDTFYYEFEWFMRRRWRKFRRNALIKQYLHHFNEIDDGVIDDDPDDDDFFFGRDYLKLYWKFADKRIRIITLPNPSKEVTGKDINAVGNFVVDNHVLVNSHGSPVVGLTKAIILTRRKENIFGDDTAPRIHPPKSDNGKFPQKKSPAETG